MPDRFSLNASSNFAALAEFRDLSDRRRGGRPSGSDG
jgi:hypothetical protein